MRPHNGFGSLPYGAGHVLQVNSKGGRSYIHPNWHGADQSTNRTSVPASICHGDNFVASSYTQCSHAQFEGIRSVASWNAASNPAPRGKVLGKMPPLRSVQPSA